MQENSSSDLRAALREVVPVLFAIAPFAMLYGTVASNSPLSLAEAVGLSVFVYAGASQLAALQLIGVGAPVWAILLTVAALNFRHVLYSASLGRHLEKFTFLQKCLGFHLLVDPSFAAGEARAEEGRLTPAYYLTYGLALYANWVFFSFVGVAFGELIDDPEAFGLDFVLPAYFLAFVLTFRTRRNFWPVAGISAVVSVVALASFGPPWHVASGALAGIAYAALATPPKRREEPAPGAVP